jgi:hypothetical protein
MAKGTVLKKSAPPSTPQAIYMIQCESMEWRQRYAQKVKQLGKVKAQTWWLGVKDDIIQIRGQATADTLINEMNKQSQTKELK